MSAKLKAKTLVQTWLEVELKKSPLSKILDTLNKKMKSAHTHSRVNEWKENRNGRGERLPRDLRVHLSKLVVKDVLINAGLDVSKLNKKALDRIAEQLS